MTQDGLGFGANGSINLHDFLAYVKCLHCLAMNFSLDSSSGAAKYDNPFITHYDKQSSGILVKYFSELNMSQIFELY